MYHETTKRIVEALEENGVETTVRLSSSISGRMEDVYAKINLDKGPALFMRFRCGNIRSNISIQIPGLINKVPNKMRFSVLSACNEINSASCFYRLCLSREGELSARCELMRDIGEKIGAASWWIYKYTVAFLNTQYPTLFDVVRGKKDLDEDPSLADELIGKCLRVSGMLRYDADELLCKSRLWLEEDENEDEDEDDDVPHGESTKSSSDLESFLKIFSDSTELTDESFEV